MKHLLTIIIALAGAAFAAAPATTGLLPSGSWELSTVNGEAPVWDNLEITLIVNEDGNHVSGKAGCNSFSGGVTEAAENVVTFGPLAATQMFCAGDGSEAEQFFFALFGKSLTVNATADTLTLTSEDTEVTYVLTAN